MQIADEMCGAKGLLLSAQDYLQPERPASQYRQFFAAEAEAISIFSYDTLFIPGLLQTEEYARDLLSTAWPPIDDETYEKRVAHRMRRQEKLRRNPPALFHFVIYEAAFRTNIGGPRVMKEQLEQLLEVSQRRNVTLQVLPEIRRAPSSLSGPMVLLETAKSKYVAYVEGQGTHVMYSDPQTVSDLSHCYGLIRTQALSAEETTAFIRKAAVWQ